MKLILVFALLLSFQKVLADDNDMLNIGYIGIAETQKNTDSASGQGAPILDGDYGFYLGFEDLFKPFKYLNFSQEFIFNASRMKTRTFSADESAFDDDRANFLSLEYRFDFILFWDWFMYVPLALPAPAWGGGLPKGLDFILGVGPLAGVYYMDMKKSASAGSTYVGYHARIGTHFLNSKFIKRFYLDAAFKFIKNMKPYEDKKFETVFISWVLTF